MLDLATPLGWTVAGGLLSLLLLAVSLRLERPWLAALALPSAALLGRLGWGAFPPFPPTDAQDWLYFLAPFAPALAPNREGQPGPGPGPALFVAGLAAGAVAEAALNARLGLVQIAGMGGSLALLVVAASSSLQAALDGPHPCRVWALVTALAFALALSLGLTGSVRLAGLAGALFIGALPLPLFASPWRGLSAAAPGFCLLFGGLAFCGATLSATPPSAALALGLGLVAAGLPRSGPPLALGALGLGIAAFAGLS